MDSKRPWYSKFFKTSDAVSAPSREDAELPTVQNTEAKPKTTINARQLAGIGLQRAGGYIEEGTVRDLRGSRGRRVFAEMSDQSAVIGSALLAIEMLIRKMPWQVKPGSSDPVEIQRAEAVASMMTDMSHAWPEFIAEILTMLVFGWSYLEIVYKKRLGPDETDSRYRSRFNDGLIGWRKFVLVPQNTLQRWEFDDEGGIAGLWQLSSNDSIKEVFVPIEKALLFRTKQNKSNPEGRSLLYNAYYPWIFTKRIMEVEGIGVERDLAGLPFAGVPPELLDVNASAEDKALLEAVKSVVVNTRRNSQEGVIFPLSYDENGKPEYDFKLLSTGGMRQFDTGKIIERYERRIAMSLLSDFILMGHERVGSLALSRDKTTLIGRALSGVVDSIAAVLNRHAVPRLYALNGWSSETPCQFHPGDLENQDIKTLGAYVKNLMSVGALTPDPGLEDALRDLGGLPPIDPAYVLAPHQPMDPNAMVDANGDPVDENGDPINPDDVPSTDNPDNTDEGSRSQKPGQGGQDDGSQTPRAKPVYPGLPRQLRPKVPGQGLPMRRSADTQALLKLIKARETGHE